MTLAAAAADACLAGVTAGESRVRGSQTVSSAEAGLSESLPGSLYSLLAVTHSAVLTPAMDKSYIKCRHRFMAELLVTLSCKRKNTIDVMYTRKNNNAQTLCHFRPKTSQRRRRLEVTNHHSFGFGSVYRNNTNTYIT